LAYSNPSGPRVHAIGVPSFGSRLIFESDSAWLGKQW